MKARLTKQLKWLNSFVPERLPQGMTEFNRWVEDISELTELPINDKLKKVVGTLILQMPPQMAYVKKRHIANLVKKAAANQVSVEVINTIDEKQKQQDTCSADTNMGPQA